MHLANGERGVVNHMILILMINHGKTRNTRNNNESIPVPILNEPEALATDK